MTSAIREYNATTEGMSAGFDAKERGRVIRVIIGNDGQLWTWRGVEDYHAGRSTTYGQQTVASAGLDALEYCEGFGIRNEETERMLSILRSRAHKELSRG